MSYRTLLVSVIVLMSLLTAAVCTADSNEEQIAEAVKLDPALMTMELMADNEYLELYLNRNTAEIAVRVKSTNDVWYSNPVDRASEEKILAGSAKDVLNSQFTINYFNPFEQARSMNSYTSSVSLGQHEISSIENGFRIDYKLGVEWVDADYLPRVISKERMDELILSKLGDQKDRDLLLDYYTLVSLEKSESRHEVFGLDMDKFMGDYSFEILSGKYVQDEAKLEADKEELARLESEIAQKELAGETEGLDKLKSERDRLASTIDRNYNRLIKDKEDMIWYVYNMFSNASSKAAADSREGQPSFTLFGMAENPTYVMQQIPPYRQRSIVAAIKSTGYTPLDVVEDHKEYGIDPPYPNLEIFSVPIEYILDGDQLVVRIPTGEIEFPKNVIDHKGSFGVVGRRVSFPLHTIDLLEFFGAAGVNDQGYIFVPDGSGALIYLNNGKLREQAYVRQLYGPDNIKEEQERTGDIARRIQAGLPVYGLKAGEKAFLAVIEEGSAISTIKADIAGKNRSYNTVFASFVINDRGTTGIGLHPGSFGGVGGSHRSEISMYPARPYTGDIVIRYSFLHGDDANYVGMAKKYQDYLVAKGELTPLTGDEAPMFVEFVGAIDRKRMILGFNRNVIEPLTTFDEAIEMVERLIEGGADDLRLRFSGWLDGGVRHRYPADVKVEQVLGGQQGFLKLNTYLKEMGVEFYPEVTFLHVFGDRMFDQFTPREHASRRPDRLIAKVYEFDPATYQRRPGAYRYVLSPRTLPGLIDSFLVDFADYDIAGLSLTYFGLEINSDFREDPELVVNRQEAADIHREQMRRLAEEYNLQLLVNHCNAVILPYVSGIVNMPLQSSGVNILDQAIPFYQIVVHGFIDYAGSPLNLSVNKDRDFLRSVECGAAPYFKWFAADTSAVLNTDFNNLLGAGFADTVDYALDVYSEISPLLRDIRTSRIVDHMILGEHVRKTVYQNGISVIVNYGQHEAVVDGFAIAGSSYLVIRESE